MKGARLFFLGKGRKKYEEGKEKIPNQQRTLNKLPPQLRCRNFVNKHRLSIRIGTKRAKNVHAMRTYIPTELPFCLAPLMVGFLFPSGMATRKNVGPGQVCTVVVQSTLDKRESFPPGRGKRCLHTVHTS